MLLKDSLRRFQRYALTNSVGVYNEDSMTAQQLNIATANKIKECLLAVDNLALALENMKEQIGLKYDGDSEELVLSLQEKIDDIREQVNSSYVCIFNENAMTSIELAGSTAKAVNECLKAVNMLIDVVFEVNDKLALSYANNSEMLILGGED